MKNPSASTRTLALASRRRARPRGFTLVEMLIVLAVVGILAAILLPAFASARASARAAACTSNLKQIGLAMLLYSHDHGGHLPRPPAPVGGVAPRCGWPDLFFRYARSAEVFRCPDDEEDRVYDPACSAAPDAPVKSGAGGYALSTQSYQLKQRNPSTLILALDGRGNRTGIGARSGGRLVLSPQTIEEFYGPPRHSGAYCMVFGDGHAKRLAPDKMLDPRFWGERS